MDEIIYLFIDVEFYEYSGSAIFVGPKMNENKVYSLVKKYYKEFEFMFQQIYDYFVEKYKMEIYAEADKDMSCIDYDSEYYIDCEVHAILEQIIGPFDEEYLMWSEYCDAYINKKLHDNHGFKQNPKYNTSFQDLSFCECCC